VAFREAQVRRVSGSIAHGPFPVRPGRLLGSFAFLFIAALCFLFAFDEDRLVCTPHASCVVTHRLRREPRPFPMSALHDATVEIEHGSKNATYGALILTVDGMGRARLGRTTPDDANAIAARVRDAIAAQQPVDEAIKGPWWALVVGLVLIPMWITMAYSALKGLGRFRLDVLRDGAALRVQRRVLGLPVATQEVSLDGIADVRIESTVLGEMWLTRGEAPAPAGRIVLVDRSGRLRPITDRGYPGTAAHLRAAAELRAVLGLPPQPGGVEEQLAALPMRTTPLGARLGFSWIGVTVGGLLGVAVYALVGLSLGLLRASDGPDGLAFALGGGGGATAGVALVFYLTRARRPA
jgi:hypothetical protein